MYEDMEGKIETAVLIVNFCATICLYYLITLILNNRKCNKIDSDPLIFVTKRQTVCTCFLYHHLPKLMHKICFKISFISCVYMFRAHVLIIRRSKLH